MDGRYQDTWRRLSISKSFVNPLTFPLICLLIGSEGETSILVSHVFDQHIKYSL